MASIDTGSGGKSPSFELNLVPFIDLMSVMITFLLVTAVWSSVSMIQIGSSIYGKKTSEEQAEPPPMAEVPFRLDVIEAGYRVVIGRESFMVPKIGEVFDFDTLVLRLEQIKQKYPDKEDAVVSIQDSLKYEELIRGMDALLVSGFPVISVSTGGAQ